MRKTNRGFRIYSEFKETYGGTVRVQQSSSIQPRVWLFHDHPDNGKVDNATGKVITAAPHLSPGQAKRLIKALQKYLADYESGEV